MQSFGYGGFQLLTFLHSGNMLSCNRRTEEKVW